MYITVYIYIDKLLYIEKYNTRTYYTAIYIDKLTSGQKEKKKRDIYIEIHS